MFSLPLPFFVNQLGLCLPFITYSKMKISFLRELVILLAFSYVVSATAVPGTRTQKLSKEDKSALPSLVQFDALGLGNDEELLADAGERFSGRRMDLEIQDYGGTSANTDHDPKSPGA